MCESYLVQMSLAVDVFLVSYSVRLAMDYVEEFVLCLQICRGVTVIDLLFYNKKFMLMKYLDIQGFPTVHACNLLTVL